MKSFEEALNQSRKIIYDSYQKILTGGKSTSLPDHLERILIGEFKESQIFWKGRIIDPDFRGPNYFFGEIMDCTKITTSDSPEEYDLIFALPETHTFEGIYHFEEFTGRLKRKVFPLEKGVLVFAGSIKSAQEDETMQRARYLLDSLSRAKKLK